MRVTVEVFGVVRDLLGGPAAHLDLPESATTRQAFAVLGQQHPQLVGAVLDADAWGPNECYLVCLDGRHFLSNLDEPLADGSALVLLSSIAGGADGTDPGRVS